MPQPESDVNKTKTIGTEVEVSSEQTTSTTGDTVKEINDSQYLSPMAIYQLTGIDPASFLSTSNITNRQKVFNGKQSINDIKIPNAGKPLNNQDPYPIDQKIKELETHQPRVKKHSVEWHHEPELAQALLDVADYAEKRIVRLENLLATVMRYTFATANRMMINCVYFGGATQYSKYKTIRCMKDDRISDGQEVQLDQCLSCTRCEPIIGKVYDILNETGTNLSIINDDCQMGYMNMKDYVEMCQVDQMHESREKSLINTNNLNQRLSNDKDFTWGNGIKMNWNLVPVESQKPQINWKQNINQPDSAPAPLSSAQSQNGHGGSGIDQGFTTQAGKAKETVSKGIKAILDQLNKNEEKQNSTESIGNNKPNGGGNS